MSDVETSLAHAIEDALNEHVALVKHVLAALVAAQVPLDCATAGALHEVASNMERIIHSAMREDEEPV